MKTGLFLTPGAARTAYQVGAVKALMTEGGLRFDVIAASSVGALNGAFAAMGEIDRLEQLWAGWKPRDIMGVDWAALVRGAIFWAPNLMHNRPQQEQVIDRFISGERLQPGIRFRINLANLTDGVQEVFEWPGAPLSLPDAVQASVSVPAAIRPFESLSKQWADGLTVDGFPLERLLLETGVDRAFVVGVAPRVADERRCRTVYHVLLRAAEWNQYSENLVGLQRAEAVNALIRSWSDDRTAVEQVVRDSVVDPDLRAELLADVAEAYREVTFPYARREVEIISVLPKHEIRMFFTAYRPARSRALLDQGRRDALRVIAELKQPQST